MAAAAATAATLLVNRSAIDLSELSRPDEPVTPAVGFAVRVVVGGEIVMRGQEFIVDGSEVTIGRGGDCGIILDERDVSRKSAKIEVVPEGFLVTDLGGSVGVWRDNQKVTSEVVPPGTHIRLGPRVVVALDLIGAEAAPAARAAPVVDADATQYIQQADAEAMRANAAAPPPPLVAATGCRPGAATCRPRPPCRFHHRRAAPPSATHAAATASVIPDAPVPPPVLSPRLPPKRGATDADFGQTVMIPVGAMPLPTVTEAGAAAPTAKRLEDVGEVIPVSAHDPFLANDTDSVWIVVTGGILLFTVALENGQPVGTRSHFLGINTGQCFFGIDAMSVGSGFLAVREARHDRAEVDAGRAAGIGRRPGAGAGDCRPGGHVGAGPLEGAHSRPAGESMGRQAAGAGGAPGNQRAVPRDIGRKGRLDRHLERQHPVRRHGDADLRSPPRALPGHARLVDHAADRRVRSARADTRHHRGIVQRRLDLVRLEVFHGLLCECEFISKKLATVDEYVRLQQKADARDAAGAAAQSAIASVMRTESGIAGGAHGERLGRAGVPRLRAGRRSARHQGLRHPNADEARTYEDQVLAIASSSGFRTRTGRAPRRLVELRPRVRCSASRPRLVRPGRAAADQAAHLRAHRSRRPATAARSRRNRRDLTPFGFTFYRPFQDGIADRRQVSPFAARRHGLRHQVAAVHRRSTIGMFGSVDAVLHRQDLRRGGAAGRSAQTLFVFGVALIGSRRSPPRRSSSCRA